MKPIIARIQMNSDSLIAIQTRRNNLIEYCEKCVSLLFLTSIIHTPSDHRANPQQGAHRPPAIRAREFRQFGRAKGQGGARAHASRAPRVHGSVPQTGARALSFNAAELKNKLEQYTSLYSCSFCKLAYLVLGILRLSTG